MATLYWKIERAIGGFSDGSRSGQRHSHRYLEFVDYKTDVDAIGVLNKPTLDSASTFTTLPLWCEIARGRTFIYDQGGKLWERVAAGSYNELRAVSDSSGQGLAFFNGALFYGRVAALGRYDMNTTYNDSFQTLTSSTTHPMKSFLNLLVIGNGNYVATLDDSNVWTSQRLKLTPEETVKSIEVWGSYVCIGTQFGSGYANEGRGNIYLWDGTSQFANDIIPTTGAVQAMANDSGSLIAWIGAQADLHMFDGGRMVKIKELPRLDGDNVEVKAGAVGAWRNQVRFGTSGGTSNTVPKGIFTYGTNFESIDKSLSYDYAPSNDQKSGAGVNIGFFKQLSATQSLFSWEYNGTYGVDRVTSEALADEATLETIIFDNGKPFLLRRPIQARIILKEPLRTDEYVYFYLKKQGETNFTKLGETTSEDIGKSAFTYLCDNDIDNDQIYSSKGHQHEAKLVWGGTGSTRPTVQSGTVLFEEDPEFDVRSS